MEYVSNPRNKKYVTISGKYICYLIFLLINLTCIKMNKQNFKVFGKQELLKNSKITIVELGDLNTENTETVLFLGKEKEMEAKTEVAAVYQIYVSYNDSVVNVLKFENIMRNANDHINHLYLTKEKDAIQLQYMGREADLVNKQGPGILLLSKEEFFKINNINTEQEIEKCENLFFNEF